MLASAVSRSSKPWRTATSPSGSNQDRSPRRCGTPSGTWRMRSKHGAAEEAEEAEKTGAATLQGSAPPPREAWRKERGQRAHRYRGGRRELRRGGSESRQGRRARRAGRCRPALLRPWRHRDHLTRRHPAGPGGCLRQAASGRFPSPRGPTAQVLHAPGVPQVEVAP